MQRLRTIGLELQRYRVRGYGLDVVFAQPKLLPWTGQHSEGN